MVNNKNIILDCGKKKYVPECIEMEEQYIKDFNIKVSKMNNFLQEYESWKERTFTRNEYGGNDLYDGMGKITHYGDRYDNVLKKQKKYENELDNYKKDEFLFYYAYNSNYIKKSNSIANYMGVIPFTPSVMINVSPHWKSGKFMKIKKNALKYAIEKYLNDCNRYDDWEAVIECGGEGNFVHAHAVAHVNPQMLKSVLGDGRPKGTKNTSHIGKGSGVKGCLQKHINKYFTEYFKDKSACEKAFNAHLKCDGGYRGLLKGTCSVQICILRNEVLVKDKKKYLIEENKPEGHKNMEVEGFPLLFTSKFITENVERNPFEG